jgi:hypothetical protein
VFLFIRLTPDSSSLLWFAVLFIIDLGDLCASWRTLRENQNGVVVFECFGYLATRSWFVVWLPRSSLLVCGLRFWFFSLTSDHSPLVPVLREKNYLI